MDPISLILGALAAGALKGIGDAAGSAIKDAYSGLKELVAARFQGNDKAALALTAYSEDPQTWALPLSKALDEVDAGQDEDILRAARALMELVDPPGAAQGKYAVTIRDSQGFQVGDHNQQSNTFGAG
ncbi:RIP homotypic interaction motif-containing protein [Kribbella monticola]|uniref:RIP homotypic interaction motif-containing protein n=1 Tax=Kribbella monticola TaxID=2185285 RepID=UPI000DD440CE|nr:RIP homotypic interaction motif-containing protein [Kribbella monticola]